MKPRSVYMARAELSLSCECGSPLPRTPEGIYVCRHPGCRWEGKELLAVTMQAAPMYLNERTAPPGDAA
jgi:hypothetical protein